MATELAKAYVQIIPSAQGIQGSISNALSGEGEGAGESSGKSFASSFGSIAKKALVGLGIGKIIADGVNNASEFETAMAKTSTLFSGTAEEFDALKSQILNLSGSYGVAATTLAEAAYSAESASVPMEQLGPMLESSAKLATAGFTDIDTALSATAKTMNAYGEASMSADDIQKVLIQTQNLGITTVGELGASLANVTPTAAAMGVSFDQVGAAMAQMTAQGVPTAQATTQLRSAMTELGKSGTKADKAFREAAKGTKYAGMSFQEAMSKGANLGDVFGMMQTYADKSGLSMVDLWGSVEAGNAAMMIASDVERFNSNLEQMSTESDVVGEAYGKMANTFGNSMNRLKESAQNFVTTLFEGGDISTSFDNMLSSLGDVGGKLLDWITTGLKTLAENLPSLMSSLLDFGESILDALGKVNWIELGTTIIEGIGGALGELGTRLIGWVTDAIGAVTNGEVDFASIGTAIWNGITSILGTAGELLKTLFEAGRDAVSSIDFSGIGSKILEGVTSLIDSAGNFLKDSFQSGLEAAESRDWPSLGEAIKTGVNLALNGCKFLSEAFSAGADLIKGIDWKNVGTHAEGLIVAGLDGASTLVSTFSDAAANLLSNIEWDKIGTGISGLMETGLEGAGKTLEAGFTAAHDFIMGINWAEVGNEVQSGIGDVWSGLTGFLGGLLGGAGEAVSGIGSGIGSAAEGIGTAIKKLFSGDDAKQAAADLEQAMRDMDQALQDGKTNIEETARNIGACIRYAIEENLTTAQMNTIGSTMISDIEAGVTETESDLYTQLENVGLSAAACFTGVNWSGVGQNIITGIINGINASAWMLIMRMTALAAAAVNAIKSALQIGSPSRVMQDDVGRWIPEGIAMGITQNSGIVEDAMNELAADATATNINGALAAQGRGFGSVADGNLTDGSEGGGLLSRIVEAIKEGMNSVEIVLYMDGQRMGERMDEYLGDEMAVRR